MTGGEIRKAFIDFFAKRGHKHVRSSSIVPHNDPTIMFTNAGMNQFKDFFLGNEIPDYPCAVTSQKVVRAGGKHNDLENVGRTARHHTFFEMLGNFSFGDYFKEDAIQYAWDFLTVEMGLPTEKLAVSVFENDDEAFKIWNEKMGVPADRIARLGEKDNFWSMGDTGPCGPCSEIHFDMTGTKEGRTAVASLEADDDRFLEIWNLVFMQFNRDESGTLNPLPKPSIDTGMGLERIAAVKQGVVSNYESDLFTPILKVIAEKAGYNFGSEDDKDVSCRVIADHLRASTFMITDGVLPSNEGRGYVMRRIIRRAARHGRNLGYAPGFLSDLVGDFVPMMVDAYPEIGEAKGHVQAILKQEEFRFSATLNQGMKILEDMIEKVNKSGEKVVSGEEIFKLYDTFGFPVDLVQDVLEDNDLSYDQSGFDSAMAEQKLRAKSAQEGTRANVVVSEAYVKLSEEFGSNSFNGYRSLEEETEILAVLKEGQRVDSFSRGDEVEVFLKKTPFYAESGGQVGDQGEIVHGNFRIKVSNTLAPVAGVNVSKGEVVETTGDTIQLASIKNVTARVDAEKRKLTEFNHTATHLLQAALRTVLGDHVKQAGSHVDSERLRFDFNHYAPLDREQMFEVEKFVNDQIRDNAQVTDEVMSFDDAVLAGAMAIFGEKYGDEVRVLSAGEHSMELCGGCHTSRTGNIGLLKLVSEQGVSAGVRRIEAVTGGRALELAQKQAGVLDDISQLLKTAPTDAGSRVKKLQEQMKEREKQVESLRKELQKFEAEQAVKDIKQIGEYQLLVKKVASDVDPKAEADALKKVLESGVVLVGQVISDEKITVVVSITDDLKGKLHAGNLVKELAPEVAGRGGGKPDMAQCGGSQPSGWGALQQKLESLLS